MASANISITVEDLTADNSETIKKALEIINGVENVIVNIANQRIVIEYDDEKISEQLIRETIEDVGYKIK
ncbi:MAG: heavy-metal-associated domain-containing protein [Clostridiaceae bacterium]|nr:heavy-metal-associated domain-containing protein [Clostridiaceae bacterium]